MSAANTPAERIEEAIAMQAREADEHRRAYEAKAAREALVEIANWDAAFEGCPWCDPDLAGIAIIDLFRQAPNMKALTLAHTRLSRAGARSSNPDGLWITTAAEMRDTGEREYLGSVRPNGSIRMNRAGASAERQPVREELKRLAAFGAAAIAAIGKATGRCCYCARLLTDPDSVELGYGPVCAVHHGLPHPNS